MTEYYVITNPDGKRWLLPVRHLRMALNIYQPSSRNGRLLKALFPLGHRIGAVRRAVHAEKINYALPTDLNQLLCEIFGEAGMEYSVFCGTPSVHQKTTIQVSHGNRILGYCKVSDNQEVIALFRHEVQILTELTNKGIDNIPRVLFCGEVTSSGVAFVQSTIKTNRSLVKHSWTAAHTEFLQYLYRATRCELPFEQTDYYKYMEWLAIHFDLLREQDRKVVEGAINVIRKYYDGVVEFSAFHADFTPWNMFFDDGKLFVFDWEYSERSFPPFMDMPHYILQTAIVGRKFDAERAYRCYRRLKTRNLIDDMLTLAYLIYVLAFYLKRGDDYSFSYVAHIELIKKILTCY